MVAHVLAHLLLAVLIPVPKQKEIVVLLSGLLLNKGVQTFFGFSYRS